MREIPIAHVEARLAALAGPRPARVRILRMDRTRSLRFAGQNVLGPRAGCLDSESARPQWEQLVDHTRLQHVEIVERAVVRGPDARQIVIAQRCLRRSSQGQRTQDRQVSYSVFGVRHTLH